MFSIRIALVLLLLSKCHSFSTNTKKAASDQNHQVKVIDHVFSKSACYLLHDLAQDHSKRSNDGSSIFIRPPYNTVQLTPIEHAIDSVLTEMGDESQKVEYWSRSEYINIDAHSDIDEQQLKDERSVRCPKNGHVLYLIVDQEIRGPTCVFPSQRKGWGDESSSVSTIPLMIVPAIEGRVLKFPGSAMHAVPKPFDRWLLDKDEFMKRQLDEKQEDLYDDDDEWEDEDSDDRIERSVLLFNTWYDDEPGPKAVNGDYLAGALPEGIELNEGDARDYLQSEQSRLKKEWQDAYGPEFDRIRCQPKSKWLSNEFEKTLQDHETFTMKISLMGDKNRHSRSKNVVHLACDFEMVKEALSRSNAPSEFHLTISSAE